MADFEKIERAAVLGCALLQPHSNHDDHAAYLDAMAKLDDMTHDSVLVLIAMRLMQGSPHQMANSEPDRLKQAMALAMHLGGSWVEKGKGTDASPRAIVLLPPPRNDGSAEMGRATL